MLLLNIYIYIKGDIKNKYIGYYYFKNACSYEIIKNINKMLEKKRKKKIKYIRWLTVPKIKNY